MKIGKWARLLLAAAPLLVGFAGVGFLAGCGDFWQAPGTTTTTTPSTLSSGNFYVLNYATMQIAGYSIASGALAAVTGSPYTLAAAPNAIAIAPSPGGFLYVSTVAPGIYLYTVGSGGVLTLGNNAQAVSQDPAAAMQVDSTGGWLVDAFLSISGVTLDAIPITSTGVYSGAKVESVSFSITNAAVHQLAFSPDNKNVFVALGTGGTLVVPFSASSPFPAGITATTIHPAATGGSALSVAVDPSSTPRLFYIGETLASPAGDSGGLRALNYSSLGSSSLTQASGSPIASGGLAPSSILPISGGDYVYVGNGQGTTSSGNIAGFTVTSTGTSTAPAYMIAAGSTIAAGTQPSGLAEDSKGNFVLAVASGGNSDLDAYTMSSGTLTSVLTATTGTDPVQAIAVAAAP
jgi:hypothetical protein